MRPLLDSISIAAASVLEVSGNGGRIIKEDFALQLFMRGI
jgi:hypothetical protein